MRHVFVAAAAALVVGCFGGLREPVPQPLLYRLESPKLAAGAALPADLRLTIAGAAPGLDGNGIASRLPGNRLDFLAGARWADRLPLLVESALIESLQASGRLRSVQGDAGRFRTTHALVVELRRFEADYTAGGMPVAEVALAVTIGGPSDRRVIAAFTAAASENAAENRQTAVVAALDAAFARAAAEIGDRAFAAIAAEPAREPAAAPVSEATRGAQPSANMRP